MLGTFIGDAVLHIRLGRIAADPPALDDCTPVAVEDYQIPISVIFDYAVLLRGGQAVRLTRIQVKPSQNDDVIEVVGTKSCCRCPRRPVSAPRCCSPPWPRGA
jgi:hypothetical protein